MCASYIAAIGTYLALEVLYTREIENVTANIHFANTTPCTELYSTINMCSMVTKFFRVPGATTSPTNDCHIMTRNRIRNTAFLHLWSVWLYGPLQAAVRILACVLSKAQA